MAKCIDITDKLSFDKNPALIIKGRKFVVNADAGTMLEIMGLFKEGSSDTESTIAALVNEIRSICENLVEMGVDVPKILIKGLEVADKAINKDGEDIDEGE